MSLNSLQTELPGVIVIEPVVLSDKRGFFMETFHQLKYAEKGIDKLFIQDNHSHSKKGVLRGLHYQLKHAQAKLIYVIRGEIFDVAVDIRKGSPTFGKWVGIVLSQDNKRQLFIPEGFAHGFCVLSDTADVIYKCTELYAPDDEYGLHWNDPDIAIEWPGEDFLISDKDSRNPMFKEIHKNFLPDYG